MGDVLAKLKVVLEASTSAYKKEMEATKKATKSVTDSIKAETSRVSNAMKMDGVTDSVKKQVSLFQKMKQAMSLDKQPKVEIGSEQAQKDLKEVQNEISKTKAELEDLLKLEKEWSDLGVPKEESLAWNDLANKITSAKEKLIDYQSKAEKMKNSVASYQQSATSSTEDTMPIGGLENNQDNRRGFISRGFGGIGRILEGVGSGIKTIGSGVIQKASGAFGALIQKFATGIPILGRFFGAQKSVSGGFGSGLKNVLKYTLGIRSLFVLVNKIRGAAVEGFQNLAQYSGETNNSISMLMSSLTQLKNSIATAFAPILNVVAPILNALIQKVISVFNVIGQLTGALTGNTTFIKAKKIQQDYAKSLNSNAASAKNAKKANEELQRTILSFDQINKMDDNSSSDSNSGISDTGGGLSPSDMFETQSIPSKIKGIADMIKQAWKNADFTEIGAMVGNKLNSALNSIPWDKIQNTCNKIAKSVATFLNGFLGTVDWNLLGNTIAKGINTAFGIANTFASNFDWGSLGAAVGNGINGALSGLDWNLIQETVRSIAKGITDALNGFIQTTDWGLVGRSFGNGINTILDYFYTGINNFDWIGAGTSLAEFVNNAINTIDFVKMGQTISDGVKGVFDFGIATIEGIDWYTVGEKVWDGLAAIDWTGIADSFFELIGASFGGLAAFLGGFISDAVAEAKKYFQEKIEECGGSVVKGILKGIGDAIAGIADWIKEHVFKPFMDGFKNAFGIHSPSTVMAEQGSYIISGLLKGVKDNIGKFLDYIAQIPGKVVKSIGDIKNKVIGKGSDIIQGLKDGISNKWDSFTDMLGSLPEKIQNAIPNLFDVGSNVIQNFANGFQSIHIPMPHIGWDWSGGRINIGNFSFSLPRFNLQWYAKGGFPEMGQLFVANENGPEMVGKMGKRNTVANNNQIVEGIKAGVFEAVLDAFNASGILDRDDSEKEVILEFALKVDSETLYKVVRKGKKKYDYRFAVAETI